MTAQILRFPNPDELEGREFFSYSEGFDAGQDFGYTIQTHLARMIKGQDKAYAEAFIAAFLDTVKEISE